MEAKNRSYYTEKRTLSGQVYRVKERIRCKYFSVGVGYGCILYNGSGSGMKNSAAVRSGTPISHRVEPFLGGLKTTSFTLTTDPAHPKHVRQHEFCTKLRILYF